MFIPTIAIIILLVFVVAMGSSISELGERVKELESRDPENPDYDPTEDPDLDDYDPEYDHD